MGRIETAFDRINLWKKDISNLYTCICVLKSLPTQPDQSELLVVVSLSTDIFWSCNMFKHFPPAILKQHWLVLVAYLLALLKLNSGYGNHFKALCGLVLEQFHVVYFWPGCCTPCSWYWLSQEEASKGDYPCCTLLWGWGSCFRWIGGRAVLWFFGPLFFLWQNLGYQSFQAWQRNGIVSFSLWLLNLSNFEHFRFCIYNFFDYWKGNLGPTN